jgi:thioredoxin reductase (NADPH)
MSDPTETSAVSATAAGARAAPRTTARPVILVVDDDPEVVRAVSRDLRNAFGEHYQIVRADSGAAALEAARTLKLQNRPVALYLADQRMPGMTGVEFLEQVLPIFPDAKRALLTAYADTDAAIRAINAVKLDYYLMKPWHPPELNLYPVIDELLGDWQAGYQPPFEGVRLIDSQWSPEAHQLRDFLARNQIPYRWLDAETSGEAHELIGCLPGAEQAACGLANASGLPLVILADGTRLTRPNPVVLAQRLGLATHSSTPFFDVLIVGGGPAGLAAAVYGASEGLSTAILEKEAPGGQAGTSSRIENYLGFPAGISGAELTRRALTQAKRFGTEVIVTHSVDSVRVEGPYKFVRLSDGTELSCHALVIASGVAYRELDCDGIDALTGAGVYYGAATTEAAACGDRDVIVVGGGNSAGQGAMFLARYARSVTIVIRGSGLAATMSRYLIDQIEKTPNIHVRPCTVVGAVAGNGRLEQVTLRSLDAGAEQTVPAAALFVYIGAEPHTDWLEGVVDRDARGFIRTGPALAHDGERATGWTLARAPFLLETSVPGIFAAGDVRCGSVKRVAAAVGEGSIAVQFIHQYLADR